MDNPIDDTTMIYAYVLNSGVGVISPLREDLHTSRRPSPFVPQRYGDGRFGRISVWLPTARFWPFREVRERPLPQNKQPRLTCDK